MNKLYKLCLHIIAACFVVIPARAQLTMTPVVSGLNSPMEIISPPDASGRMFIIERAGTIRILTGTTLATGNFLDITALVSTLGERGLLSLAFHPGYATNRYFFLLYNNPAGDLVLSRYRTDAVDPNLADPASGTILMSIPHPTNTNHNGGKLAFGTDGNLFWSTGDGGSSNDPLNNAQNGNSLLGKMLRLNVDSFNTAPYYVIPADNPFVGNPAVADEIWNLGLRNPFRWSFDRLNGDMWIGDVGQGAWEEVDRATLAGSSGLNYGWRCREGAHDNITGGCAPTGYTDPVFEYDRTVGQCITGGYVYRGSNYPSIYGKYICVDFLSNNAFIVTPGATAPYAAVMQAGMPGSITSFGEDATGELYATTIGGTIYAVEGNAVPLPVELTSFAYKNEQSGYQLQWTAVEKDIRSYEIQRSSDGKIFAAIGQKNALNRAGESHYTFSLKELPVQEGYYRLRMESGNGEKSYSKVLAISKQQNTGTITIYPTVVDKMLTVKADIPWQRLVCTDITGKVVKHLDQETAPGYTMTDVSAFTPGIYFAHITRNDGSNSVHRFIVSR